MCVAHCEVGIGCSWPTVAGLQFTACGAARRVSVDLRGHGRSAATGIPREYRGLDSSAFGSRGVPRWYRRISDKCRR